MKVFFDKVYQLNADFQEVLIDEDNFGDIEYTALSPSKQSVNGVIHDDIYVLEPLNYYEIILRKDTPSQFDTFTPALRLLRAGLIISSIDKKNMCLFVYNCTHNHIFLRPKAVIGEIE